MSKPKLKLKLKTKCRVNRFTDLKELKEEAKKRPIQRKSKLDFAFCTFDCNESSVLKDLMAIVDSDENSSPPPQPKRKLKLKKKGKKKVLESICKKQKERTRKESEQTKASERGRSMPNTRTKENLIKMFNLEGIKEVKEEEEKKRERKKSMIVITERFCNTKGSEPFLPDEKLTNDICKKVSEISTTDCKSVNYGVNPYDDNAFSKKRSRSNGPTQSNFLDNLDDLTPQKLHFMSPNTKCTNSNSKVTPGKRSRSTLKITVAQSPLTLGDGKSRTPRIVIPKRKVSTDRSSQGSSMNACPKLKIKRKNPSVEKLYRIAQTEKKPKGNNAQLKRYQPLTKVYKQHSEAKEKAKNYYNRDLTTKELKFVQTPELQLYDRSEDLGEEAKSTDDQYPKVEVTFGNLNEGTQRDFQRAVGYDDFMKDKEILIQEKVMCEDDKENLIGQNISEDPYLSPGGSHSKPKSERRRKRKEHAMNSPIVSGEKDELFPSCAQKLQF